jgi:hypothetical protein
VAFAEPEPELTEPELDELPELELELEPELDELPFVDVVVPDVLVVSSFAWEAAAAPITIVAATAATVMPDVTATVLRRALSRWFIEPSCCRWFDDESFNWVRAARCLGLS